MIFFQQPWLIDIDSNSEAAKTTLTQLCDQLAHCQEQAAQFKAYQRAFKVLFCTQIVIKYNILVQHIFSTFNICF